MSNFTKSVRPVASFTFQADSNLAQNVNLCLVPGHYNTIEAVYKDDKIHISYADPTAIKAAGYDCNQVADDFNAEVNNTRGDGNKYPITIKSKGNVLYRDFLNYVKYSGLKIVKMRITDLTPGANPSRDIFQQVIEVTESLIGAKAGSDYVQLSSYINPANYLQNFIEIDLEKDGRNLKFDETSLVFLRIPPAANFQIDFTLAE